MPIADHGASAVVDLEFFAGRGLDYRTGFRRLAPTKLADESFDALIAAGEAIDIHQILPDRLGVATFAESRFNGFHIRFADAGRGASAGFRFWCRQGFAGRLSARVGGHLPGLTGRFW